MREYFKTSLTFYLTSDTCNTSCLEAHFPDLKIICEKIQGYSFRANGGLPCLDSDIDIRIALR